VSSLTISLATPHLRGTTAPGGRSCRWPSLLKTIMLPSSRITGTTARHVLAVFAVIGQSLGTIGIIPVRADFDEDSSTPFPCKDLPCGCRTAAKCWAGACCCYTMQQKIAWAAEHGIIPPDHAIRIAAEEMAQEHNAADNQTDSIESCCSKKEPSLSTVDRCRDGENAELIEACCLAKHTHEKSHHEQADRRSGPVEFGTGSKTPTQHGVNWVAGLFAQKCQGQGFDGLGHLNIGIAPSPPIAWTFDSVFVDGCDLPDQIPIPMPIRPLVPPPKA
jgi:hypothetical protein